MLHFRGILAYYSHASKGTDVGKRRPLSVSAASRSADKHTKNTNESGELIKKIEQQFNFKIVISSGNNHLKVVNFIPRYLTSNIV